MIFTVKTEHRFLNRIPHLYIICARFFCSPWEILRTVDFWFDWLLCGPRSEHKNPRFPSQPCNWEIPDSSLAHVRAHPWCVSFITFRIEPGLFGMGCVYVTFGLPNPRGWTQLMSLVFLFQCPPQCQFTAPDGFEERNGYLPFTLIECLAPSQILSVGLGYHPFEPAFGFSCLTINVGQRWLSLRTKLGQTWLSLPVCTCTVSRRALHLNFVDLPPTTSLSTIDIITNNIEQL